MDSHVEKYMNRKTVPIVVTSLLLGLVFNWFFYGNVPGISVFIYTSLVLGFTVYLARRFKQPLNTSIYWLAPVILFFSSMVFIRASLFMAFVNILLITYLLLLVARLAQRPGTTLSQFTVSHYFNFIGRLPTRFLQEFFLVIQNAASSRNNRTTKSSYLPVLRGVLISLPILFVFLLLLSSADLVFKKYIGSIFDLSINPETFVRWGLIGFVTSLFTGAYAFIFMPSSRPEAISVPKQKVFTIGTTESTIILGSVAVLFFVFVMVQLAYLFGGSEHIASTGYTYAQYARKGFFELIVVAAISFLLIWTIKKSTKFQTLMQSMIFNWLSGILAVEVMIIMLSAHRRLNLYEEAYGFTTLRLWSHLFILWLAAAFILLLVHIVHKKSENQFVLQLFISALCFFALINLINPDNFIARQNIDRFTTTGKLDTYYLGGLSEDATPAVAKLLSHPDEKVRKSAASILYQQKQYVPDQFSDWQSANLARHRADQIFRDNASQIEDAKLYGEYQELSTD